MSYYEFIPNKLYFTASDSAPHDNDDQHFFTTERDIVYKAYNAEFGPFSLAQMHQFYNVMQAKLNTPELHQKKLVYYSSTKIQAITNAVTCIALFCLSLKRYSPLELLAIIKTVTPQPIPFIDISDACTYGLTIEDLLYAVQKAMKSNIYNPHNFDTEKYLTLADVKNGMISEIVRGKVFACPSPIDPTHPLYKKQPLPTSLFTTAFKKLNITAIIRLNDSYYNKTDFVKNLMHHYDLPFADGGNPTDEIVVKFFKIVEEEPAVCVHCMAGLGRTGTLICLYMMKYLNFTARESIAWVRLLRPGSVSGNQQSYICSMEDKLKRGKLNDMIDGESKQRKFYAKPSGTGYQTLNIDSDMTPKNRSKYEDTMPVEESRAVARVAGQKTRVHKKTKGAEQPLVATNTALPQLKRRTMNGSVRGND